MQIAEKDGMKLYAKIGEVKGGHAASLQTSLEDSVTDMWSIMYIYICIYVFMWSLRVVHHMYI
jgi:hypothetical protein